MSGTLGISGAWTEGLLFDSEGNVGFSRTYGFGIGAPADVTAGVSVAASNAPNIDNYKDQSWDVAASGGAGLAGTIDASYWPTGGGPDGNSPYYELGFTGGGGGGASIAMQRAQTYVTPLFNIPTLLDEIKDMLFPQSSACPSNGSPPHDPYAGNDWGYIAYLNAVDY